MAGYGPSQVPESGVSPFFSPDGRALGLLPGTRPEEGPAARRPCGHAGRERKHFKGGAFWAPDDTIVYATDEGTRGVVRRIPSTGGGGGTRSRRLDRENGTCTTRSCCRTTRRCWSPPVTPAAPAPALSCSREETGRGGSCSSARRSLAMYPRVTSCSCGTGRSGSSRSTRRGQDLTGSATRLSEPASRSSPPRTAAARRRACRTRGRSRSWRPVRRLPRGASSGSIGMGTTGRYRSRPRAGPPPVLVSHRTDTGSL